MTNADAVELLSTIKNLKLRLDTIEPTILESADDDTLEQWVELTLDIDTIRNIFKIG